LERCWNTDNPLHVRYHDQEWGVPLHDDQRLFEFLVLGGFQAGLTWWLILQRREYFRQAFDNFQIKKVAQYDSRRIEKLMSTPQIIHNRAKILAAINNASKVLEVQKEFGSFDRFIWGFVGGKPFQNSFGKLEELPAETDQSRAMSKKLKSRGFQFVGPTICYAFMQATGMVNDHITPCFRHQEVKALARDL
jgi:DNA-3-methyladenine glycosylase I